MAQSLMNMKPKFNPVSCRRYHKFVRYTGHAWRIVGIAKPLPDDVCRHCGRTRGVC